MIIYIAEWKEHNVFNLRDTHHLFSNQNNEIFWFIQIRLGKLQPGGQIQSASYFWKLSFEIQIDLLLTCCLKVLVIEEFSCWQQRPYDAEKRKYLLSGPLQNKFTDPELRYLSWQIELICSRSTHWNTSLYLTTNFHQVL